MSGLFVAIAFLGFFGSLSRFTPNTPWADVSYFFRKNKKDYLAFSNKFRGNYYLILGLFSLVFFILSLFISFKMDGSFSFIVLVVYVCIAESILQIKWYNLQKDKRELI